MNNLMEAREQGISRSAGASERSGWRADAYQFLLSFARTHQIFSGEDVSNAHIADKLPQPDDLRWWGPLYRAAVRDGYIAHFDNNGWSNRRSSPCPRYRSLWVQRNCGTVSA